MTASTTPVTEDSVVAKREASREGPRSFGRYRLFDYIGKGGMAEIHLARAKTELGGGRLCVVKQIAPGFADDAQFAEMLTYEAKLAARLNHANIVQVFDLGRADGNLYIAMEYVEGFDLNALLRQCSKSKIALPVEFALRIVCDALKALDYAHRRLDDDGKPLGIVHRDVSPSNLLVSFEGEIKLCDFGIAHANDAVRRHGGSLEDAIKGKAGYMSPEHARGEKLDARADVFAVGIVLWELLAGRRMYKRDDALPSLLEQARDAVVPPVAVRSLPHEDVLHAIVKKALSREREDRFPSAGAMLKELEDYVRLAKLGSSPLRLGEWLVESFGTDIVTQRRARQRASEAFDSNVDLAAAARAALKSLEPAPVVNPPKSSSAVGFEEAMRVPEKKSTGGLVIALAVAFACVVVVAIVLLR